MVLTEVPATQATSWITALSSRHPAFGSVWTQAAAHTVPGLRAKLASGSRRLWMRGHAGCPAGPSPGYLETRELLWDWPEEDEVAALSWEKPLVQDSRLDMEPLGRKGATQTLPSGGDPALGPMHSGGKAGSAVKEAPGLFP